MIYQAPFPAELGTLTYVRLYLFLQFVDDCHLPIGALLQLRRELFASLKQLEAEQGIDVYRALHQALQPKIADSKREVPRIQKLGSSIILSPEVRLKEPREDNNQMCLPVLFVGDATLVITHFLDLIDRLGDLGLYHGQGRFSLQKIESEDASGRRDLLWQSGAARKPLTPPVNDFGWWLDLQVLKTDQITLEFMTPARLISHGRPLFKPTFARIFPFVMRRVNQILGHHLNLSVIENPVSLMQQAAKLKQSNSTLTWHDWRQLDRGTGHQDLGGIIGRVELHGEALGELFWILQLGRLFNLGKGASFGAGQYRLIGG
jgi:hypothetical protein